MAFHTSAVLILISGFAPVQSDFRGRNRNPIPKTVKRIRGSLSSSYFFFISSRPVIHAGGIKYLESPILILYNIYV
jgi:hypothetical protein